MVVPAVDRDQSTVIVGNIGAQKLLGVGVESHVVQHGNVAGVPRAESPVRIALLFPVQIADAGAKITDESGNDLSPQTQVVMKVSVDAPVAGLGSRAGVSENRHPVLQQMKL